ncbi:SRPBCC family protein [uncultured Streptomyces sp.]|uniref:SRPBCC family protein n=1 Tax=uncultured Streptomyces sp. TaxID=174707 RepID=UPI002621B144|nr:SRPBCC family protein [uncultured Streptomyces sp.]
MESNAPATRHISTHIDRSVEEVYKYASDPARLPEWAAGLSGSIEKVDGKWIAQSPMGRVVVDFAPENAWGVLDHYVTLESGQTFYNPVRVIADGEGAEVVFTLRRQPEMTDAEFQRDTDAITADLAALKTLLERG